MDIADPRVNPVLVPEGSRASIANDARRSYRDLPSIVTPTGRVITRWRPTQAEREAVASGEDIFVTVLSSDGVINPFYVTVGPVNWRNEV